MSRTGVPSNKSRPRTWMTPAFSSTFVMWMHDRPIEFGRCGDLVAKTPCLLRGPRGGVTKGLNPWLRWKKVTTQQYSKSASPRNESWYCARGNNLIWPACAEFPNVFSVTLGCRGVPNRSCQFHSKQRLWFNDLHDDGPLDKEAWIRSFYRLTLYGDRTTPMGSNVTVDGVSKSSVYESGGRPRRLATESGCSVGDDEQGADGVVSLGGREAIGRRPRSVQTIRRKSCIR